MHSARFNQNTEYNLHGVEFIPQGFVKENRNVYRGYFPVQPGNLSCKEGFEAGEDVEATHDPAQQYNPLLGTSCKNGTIGSDYSR